MCWSRKTIWEMRERQTDRDRERKGEKQADREFRRAMPPPKSGPVHLGALLDRPPPDWLPVVDGHPPLLPGPMPFPAPGRPDELDEELLLPCPFGIVALMG